MSVIARLNPINKAQEKKKFFFDTNYNPQFTFAEPVSSHELQKFGEVSDEYLDKALNIINSVIKKWGNESSFLEEAEGDLLTKDKVIQITQAYLIENQIADKVKIRFLKDQVSPGSMTGNIISFREPIAARSFRIEGTLNHEIGTHFFRRLNDECQPWHSQRDNFGLQPYTESEEGLATLHSHLNLKIKYVWFAALYYVSVYQAKQMSFSQLFSFLKGYVDDGDRRWNIAMRAKRGVSDTSKPGAIAKDQVYLSGVIKMLGWLEHHGYDPRSLYLGKIAVEDLDIALRVQPSYSPILPKFLNDDQLSAYASAIKEIKTVNNL